MHQVHLELVGGPAHGGLRQGRPSRAHGPVGRARSMAPAATSNTTGPNHSVATTQAGPTSQVRSALCALPAAM